MRKKLSISMIILLITSFLFSSTDTTLVFASNHVHTDACYALTGTYQFNYTGTVQTFTAPASGKCVISVWGAQGFDTGGLGGYATGNYYLTQGQVIYLYVGSLGGWNGGGYGAYYANTGGGSGGGATDIRVGGTALSNRIIVAGGGGGGGWYYDYNSATSGKYRGGAGGGLTGGSGGVTGGGSQTAGGVNWGQGTPEYSGSFGQGGTAIGRAGGGGGGYYGGAGGHEYQASYGWNGYSGSGGSGYIGGVSNGSMASGVRSGNGLAVIEFYELKCTAATIAPTVNLTNMTSNTILTESNTNFCPQIKVFDNENDSLTCNYYLDGSATAAGTLTAAQSNPESTQTFSNGINAANLSEGTHTIKVTAADDMAPVGSSTLSFKVDKYGPLINSVTITNTTSSINLTASATDAVAGLAANAYRYTVNGAATDWLTASSYSKSGLAPNSTNSYSVEVKDSVGHICTKTGSAYTKAAAPSTTATVLEGDGAQLVIKDSNPAGTLYRVKLGSQYANTNGTLSQTESWITIPYDSSVGGKKLVIPDLTENTVYSITVSAKNSGSGEITVGNSTSITTAPGIPSNFTADTINSSIYLKWNSAAGAVNYELYRETVTANGAVIATKTIPIVTNYYSDKDIAADRSYRYKIRCKNQNNIYGNWTGTPITADILFPVTPTITSVTGTSISANITWSSVNTATGYDIEADGTVYNAGQKVYFEDSGLTPGSHHVYRLRARNAYGNSYWSAQASYDSSMDAPNTPVGLIAAVSGSQIVARWDTVQGAASYDIKIDSEIHNNVLTTEYTAAVSGSAISDTEHMVSVRAVNNGGASEWSTAVTAASAAQQGDVPALTIPAVPTVTGSISGSSIVTVSWNTVSGAAWYQLEADNSVIYSGSETNYVHSALAENSQHSYRVRACNWSGASEWSSPLSMTTGASNATKPGNVNYYRVSDSTTAITWNKAASINSYRIEINGVVSNSVINDSSVEIATTLGEQYIVRIASVTQNGNDWSDAIVFRASNSLLEAPAIAAIAAGTNSVTLSWNKVTGASGYEIEVNGNVVSVGNVLNYSISGLALSTSYKIRVRACNETGTSSWSDAKTVMTSAATAGVPAHLTGACITTVGAITGGAIEIKWDAVTGAISYQVEGSNDVIYNSNTNSIVINNLTPGESYSFRVRAVTSAGAGSWSSRISIVPEGVIPTNVTAALVNGAVRISWDSITGATYYEIEIDGITYRTSNSTSIDLPSELFYLQRMIRVRACNAADQSEWSEEVLFRQEIPVSISVSSGEELSVILPFKNIDISNYKLTLTFDMNEMELLDACEMTTACETVSTYLSDQKTHIVITQTGNDKSITFLIDEDDGYNRSSIASSIKMKSKITGTATLKYWVTKK